MYILALIIHVLVCLFLVVVVLLQSGKAADLAGAFGGMGSQTAFGPRGSATLLSKATTISFVIFIITSMTLSILATRGAGLATTVLEGAPPAKTAPAKTTPPPTPAPAPQQQAPMTVTPEGGKPVTVPAPSQPANPGTPAPTQPATPKK
jgi:preprotein translocase subunit SecG